MLRTHQSIGISSACVQVSTSDQESVPPVVAEAPDGGDETAVRGMATTAVPSAASQRVADAVVHLRNCMQSAGHADT